MKHKLQFGTVSQATEALQTKRLIADINRIVAILDGDIAAEEKRAQIFDRARVEYPMTARTMAGRRDNLLSTVGALEQRLAKQQVEPIAQLA
jgi:hypothetical protein